MTGQQPLTWFGGRPGALRPADRRLHLLTEQGGPTFCGFAAGTTILVVKPSQAPNEWCLECLEKAQQPEPVTCRCESSVCPCGGRCTSTEVRPAPVQYLLGEPMCERCIGQYLEAGYGVEGAEIGSQGLGGAS